MPIWKCVLDRKKARGVAKIGRNVHFQCFLVGRAIRWAIKNGAKHKKLLWLERKITENNYKNAAFQWYGSNARLDSLFRMHANFLLRLISASIQGQYRRNMQVHLILRMPRPAAELVEQHMAQLPAFHEGISDVSLRAKTDSRSDPVEAGPIGPGFAHPQAPSDPSNLWIQLVYSVHANQQS